MKFDVMVLVSNKLLNVVDVNPFFQQDLSHIQLLDELKVAFRNWAVANLDLQKISDTLAEVVRKKKFEPYDERSLFTHFRKLERYDDPMDFFIDIEHFMPIWDVFTLSDEINSYDHKNALNDYTAFYQCVYCSNIGDFIVTQSLEVEPVFLVCNLFPPSIRRKVRNMEQVKTKIKTKINNLSKSLLSDWIYDYEMAVGELEKDVKEAMFDTIQFITMQQMAEFINQKYHFDSDECSTAFRLG